jgi:hypothetical protein
MFEEISGNPTDDMLQQIQEKISEFSFACEGFKLELSDCVKDKQQYKQKFRQYRITLKQFNTDLAWQKTNSTKNALLEGATAQSALQEESEDALIQHGLEVQQASSESLQRTLAVTAETQVIARSTAQTLDAQTQQLTRMYDDLEKIDSALDRSTVLMRRMARRVLTDKYIWVLIFLVIVAVIVIIVYKTLDPEGGKDLNAPELDFGTRD